MKHNIFLNKNYLVGIAILIIIASTLIIVSAGELNAKQEKNVDNGEKLCCGIDTAEDAPPNNTQKISSASSTTMISAPGNIKTFRTDTAPELDLYQPCNGGDKLIDFFINVHDVDLSAIKSAKLTLAVWDVDFDCGMPGQCERDTVYVNGHLMTTPVSFLTGANGQWSTVTFDVEPGWIKEGDNDIKIYIDTLNTGYWCVEADWGELAVELKDIDLKVESKDIVISPKHWLAFWKDPYDISATIHNDGAVKAENVKVKIVRKLQNVEIESETKTISEILPGGSATTTVNWNLDFDQDVEVFVDPTNTIDESKEDNNKAITTKTTGTIINSANQRLAHLPVTYQEKVGGNWIDTAITVYTDSVGKYYIFNNLNAITAGREGRTKADLMYSPAHDAENAIFRIIDDSAWGNGETPASTTPVSKISTTIQMDKSQTFVRDLNFAANEGGVVYPTLVQVHTYHKGRGSAPSPEIQVEINNDEKTTCGGLTSCYVPGTTHIHFIPTHQIQSSSIGHEYTHWVEDGWDISDAWNYMEEGSAHWGAAKGTGTSNLHITFPGIQEITIDISDDAQTNGGLPANSLELQREFQIAGTYWDLNENNVWDTLKDGGRWPLQNDVSTPRNFYNYYKDRNSNPSPTIKNVFRAHGYNTTGWPGKNGDDPFYFTGNYKDFKIDKNSDGIAEYLNIDVEVDIPTPGYYILSGGIQGLELGASNYSYLNSGIQNVSLKFYGEALFESGINGPYNLSVFLGDGTYQILDYRLGSYLTSIYSFTEFARPVILFTGNYNNYGIDSDSNGLYDFLTMDVEVNVTRTGNYEIYGNLYAGDTFIDYAKNYTYLNEGISTVKLNFDGVTIHANGINGPYKLKDLTIPGSYPIYSSAYSYIEFQIPGANLESIISDSGIDIDADGLYNQLEATVNIDCSLSDNYTISGYLYDSSGRHIISGFNNTYLKSGSQNIQLDFDGTIIRNEGKNGPYNLTIELYDSNSAFIAKKTSVTSKYDFTQFQISPQKYFEMTFEDYGLDIGNNGLFDYLTVELNISSIIKTGDYRLDGYLYNENGSVAFASATSYIGTQTRNVKLNFSGQDIWRSKVLNSSYNLDIEIYDNNSTLVVKLPKVHTTSKYRYNNFQSPKAIFKEIYSDYGLDMNSDGLFDYLILEVGLNVTTAGNYSLQGSLDDTNGNIIIENKNITYLNTGYQSIILNFDGASIYKHGVNGPYNLTNLLLYDENGTLIDNRNYAYTTSIYGYNEFQRPSVLLTGNYSEYPTDTDGNGLFDTLGINVEIIVQDAGNYALNARLMDNNGNEIVWASANSWLSAGQPQIMKLNFDGININKNGVNGSYFLRDVYIYDMSDVSKSANVYDAYTTYPYKYSEFEFLLSVTSPNGGENWRANTKQVISWNYTGFPGSYAKIELLKGGLLNSTINASVPIGNGGSGSYNWQINPIQALGTDYKIRVTSTTNPDYSDTSDNNFTISAQKGINLITNPDFENGKTNWTFYTNGTGNFSIVSPGYNGTKAASIEIDVNGTNIQLYQKDVTLEPKSIYRLSFAANSTTGHDMLLRLYQHASPFTDYGLNQTFDLGTSWQTFSTEFTALNLTNTVNDGRLTFRLEQFATPGDIYYIDDVRLEKIGVDNSPPGVIGNTPAGTNISVTTPITITFNEPMYQNATQSAFSTFPVSSGNFSWNGSTMTFTPTSNLVYGTTYTVMVGTGAKDLAGNNMESPFSWQFSTIPPGIKVTSPNGGENWTRGTTKMIKWTSTGTPGGYVKLELLKGGVPKSTIISSTPNDGSHLWPIPGILAPGTDYKIRITSTTKAAYTDTSDDNFTIPTPSFAVVSPNGSENWIRGTTQTIRWNSTESPKSYVKIELIKPGVPNKLIVSSTLNDGSHPWLIPATQMPGTDYKVKITSTINAAVNDTSDNNFIIPVPSFKVTSPNCSESWIRGTTQTIRWNSTENPKSYVKIELIRPGVPKKLIVSSTLNDGSHPWIIPGTQMPGTDYKVKITSTINVSNNDTSDCNFIIPVPSFKVTSPNGSESWIRGSTQTIRWNSTESPKSYVKIELLKPGKPNQVIISSTLNDGSHPWFIPAAQTPGTDYKVKITSTTNASNYDTSDDNFTIPNPTINVLSPNGGENWRKGTTQTIKWNSSGSPGAYVKIELLKAGVFNRVIVSSTLNDGSHPWLIPVTQTPGTDYKVKITSTSNLSYNDVGNNNFIISS